MLMRNRGTVGFVEPCLPSPAKKPPTGSNWLHEIKHDGFRIMALRDAAGGGEAKARRRKRKKIESDLKNRIGA